MKQLVLTNFLCCLLCLASVKSNAQSTIIHYKEDTVTLFPNPERGWAVSINPDKNIPAPALVLSELKAARDGADKLTLVRKYYLLHDYTDKPIAPSFLDDFQKDLNACRQAGVKLIPRFAYIWSPAATNKDAPLPIALNHLQQLKPYFNNNWDVIAFLEAGFVGSYGEWHDTFNDYLNNKTNELKTDGIILIDSLLAALPVQRFLAMRYVYWHKYKFYKTPLTQGQAFDTTLKQARIGYHHDYMMQSEEWSVQETDENLPPYKLLHAYYVADTKWVPHTGEPCSGSEDNPYYKLHDPRPELRELHQSTLINNSCIDYAHWKNKPWYNGLTRDLGYRLSLKKIALDKNVKRGNKLRLQIEMANTGYAAPFNERKFEIIIRNKSTGKIIVVDVTNDGGYTSDPRYWLPGHHVINLSIPIAANAAPGKYELLLNFPDPAPLLHNRAEYSIRLANKNCWEVMTGYNKCNVIVVVK